MPEEQKRLTVVAATLGGNPAINAATRATFVPCTPCGCAQPRMTSPISAGSSVGVLRRTSRTQCAARSSGRVMLNDPRYDFASAVRELATTTASLIRLAPGLGGGGRGFSDALIKIDESFAFFGKPLQQRRRRPEVSVLLPDLLNPRIDLLQTDGIGVPHRPTTISGESVAIDINDVDVDGPQRVAFLQNPRAFVHQRVDDAVDDLFIGNRARCYTGVLARLPDQAVDFRIVHRLAVGIVFIPAGASLLPVLSLLAETIFQ